MKKVTESRKQESCCKTLKQLYKCTNIHNLLLRGLRELEGYKCLLCLLRGNKNGITNMNNNHDINEFDFDESGFVIDHIHNNHKRIFTFAIFIYLFFLHIFIIYLLYNE